MKQPGGRLLIIVSYVLLLIFSSVLIALFTTYYGATSIADSVGGYYEPFLYTDAQTVPLARIMLFFILLAQLSQIVVFFLVLIGLFSKSWRLKSVAPWSIFIFYIFIFMFLWVDYSISYTYGIQAAYNENFVPQDDPAVVEKYVAYFTQAAVLQFEYFLDPISISIIFILLLLLALIVLIRTVKKNNKFLNKTEPNNSQNVNSTVVNINTSPDGPTKVSAISREESAPIIINTPPQQVYNSNGNERQPIIINNEKSDKSSGQPIIISNPQSEKSSGQPIIISNTQPEKSSNKPIIISNSQPEKSSIQPIIISDNQGLNKNSKPVTIINTLPQINNLENGIPYTTSSNIRFKKSKNNLLNLDFESLYDDQRNFSVQQKINPNNINPLLYAQKTSSPPIFLNSSQPLQQARQNNSNIPPIIVNTPQPQNLQNPNINMPPITINNPQPQNLQTPNINMPPITINNPQPQNLKTPNINMPPININNPQSQNLKTPNINMPPININNPQPQNLQNPNIPPIIVNNPQPQNLQNPNIPPIIVNNLKKQPFLYDSNQNLSNSINVPYSQSKSLDVNNSPTIILNNPAQSKIKKDIINAPDFINEPYQRTLKPEINNSPTIIINNMPHQVFKDKEYDLKSVPINRNHQIKKTSSVTTINKTTTNENNYKTQKSSHTNINDHLNHDELLIKPEKHIYNNIFLNKILHETDNLFDAKILIKKILETNNADIKNNLLILVYKICLNNNYLNEELKNAIYETVSLKLPKQYQKKELIKNMKESVEYYLENDKKTFKKLMFKWISLIENSK